MRKRIVIVTGMSGAGKTSAMGILEDIGYHCIDRYPAQLLNSLLDLIEKSSDPRFDYVALATSAVDFPQFMQCFSGSDMDVRVLYLDASNETLLLRYKSTRRTHPLLVSNSAHTLEEAIGIEREMYRSIKDTVFLSVDTTFLTHQELKKKLDKYFSPAHRPVFSISFISFGYKHGVPLDADLMFDVRFLPNPFWEKELREFTGNDECVYSYVIEKPETEKFLKKLTDFLDYAFEEYVKEGKNHFTVAIGCTGGQHRSVSVTNYLYELYKVKYNCFKEHRDIKEFSNGK